jgi:hypothetical protein
MRYYLSAAGFSVDFSVGFTDGWVCNSQTHCTIHATFGQPCWEYIFSKAEHLLKANPPLTIPRLWNKLRWWNSNLGSHHGRLTYAFHTMHVLHTSCGVLWIFQLLWQFASCVLSLVTCKKRGFKFTRLIPLLGIQKIKQSFPTCASIALAHPWIPLDSLRTHIHGPGHCSQSLLRMSRNIRNSFAKKHTKSATSGGISWFFRDVEGGGMGSDGIPSGMLLRVTVELQRQLPLMTSWLHREPLLMGVFVGPGSHWNFGINS